MTKRIHWKTSGQRQQQRGPVTPILLARKHLQAREEQAPPKLPNFVVHQRKHLEQPVFLNLMREQLARDCGVATDCQPLYIEGFCGGLWRTPMDTKWLQKAWIAHMRHEEVIHRNLRPIQGKYVPVCLGSVNLTLTYYIKWYHYTRLLFLKLRGVWPSTTPSPSTNKTTNPFHNY